MFDQVVDRGREHKLLKARTRQRTDSPHVLAAVRDLNRRERGVETLRAAVTVGAPVAPDWVGPHLPTQWGDRYRRRAEGDRVPAEAKARERLAEYVRTDGQVLLELLWSPTGPT